MFSPSFLGVCRCFCSPSSGPKTAYTTESHTVRVISHELCNIMIFTLLRTEANAWATINFMNINKQTLSRNVSPALISEVCSFEFGIRGWSAMISLAGQTNFSPPPGGKYYTFPPEAAKSSSGPRDYAMMPSEQDRWRARGTRYIAITCNWKIPA